MDIQERRLVIERYAKALEAGETSFEPFHQDCVWEWPQSGERIVGVENQRAILEHYPSMPKIVTRRIHGDGDLWVMEWTGDYDGELYQGVSVAEFREDKVVRVTEYFAHPFEPPEWRAGWVELTAV
jgi:hypothetical protein